jgi:hypothetical protein
VASLGEPFGRPNFILECSFLLGMLLGVRFCN